MTKSILLVGVGGQGTILASKLLTIGLMEAGYDVKMSEIHGMSQRGGSVSSHIRYGEEVCSPVIEPGTADLLVSFETMEALRWMKYLKPEGKIIVNDCRILPLPVIMGSAEYADDIEEQLKSKVSTVVVKASLEAEKLGNAKVTNIVLLGSLTKMMGLTEIDWEKIIKENVKPAFIDLNLAAFKRGAELVE